MPPRCHICTHPACEAMNAAVAAGSRAKTLSKRFGVSRTTLRRHIQHCLGLPPQPSPARKACKACAPLRAQVQELQAQVAYWQAEAQDWETSYTQAARAVLRLRGQLTSEPR